MKFGSVCSGIEAASVAWNKLGWTASWLAEIEPFPSAVLAHHYPDVPNLGDMTLLPAKILSGEIEAPDIFCGGTPCQAFSIAGNRESLDDARGNLSLTFCEIANAIDSVRDVPAIIFWENVPGVLNTKDNAFGCFLAGLAGEDGELKPAGKKWTNAGCVFGPKRTVAWRILDAQYFGLAQRRKRVFVVASARDDFNPAEVLFEFDGVRRDSAPGRNSRETTAANAQSGIGSGSNPETVTTSFTPSSFAQYSEGVGTLRANGGDLGGGSESIVTTYNKQSIGSGSNSELMATLCATDNDKWGSNQWVNEGKAIIEHSKSVYEMHAQDARVQNVGDVLPTMSATYGSGGGNIPVTYGIHTDAFSTGKNHHARPDGHGNHLGISEETAYSLTRAAVNAVAYNITFCDANGTRKDRPDGGLYVNETNVSNALTNAGVGTNVLHTSAYSFDSLSSNSMKSSNPHSGCNEIDVSKTLDTSCLNPSCNQGGVALTHAFKMRSGCDGGGKGYLGQDEKAFTISTHQDQQIFQQMAVRRLTPTECERLQGFPDGYTQIPWRKKPAEDCPDGPRYKALGNSWAVPVVAWIGERIAKELLK